MSNELITIEDKNVLTVYSSNDGLRPIIDQVRAAVEGFEHDLTKKSGRDKTASLSAKVSRMKVRLDNMGKDLTKDWKEKAKLVDANRKILRDELDELRDLARKPLDEWEKDQENIKKEKELEALRKEIDLLHEMGLLMNDKFDSDKKAAEAAEAERIEQERAAYEERLKSEAAAQAEAEKLALEEEIETAKAKAEQDAKYLELFKIQQEEKRLADIELQKIREKQAQELAEKQAVEREQAARQKELDRQEMERVRIEQEKSAREANRKHVASIRGQAKEDLMDLGLTEELSRKVVLAIDKNVIKNITINY